MEEMRSVRPGLYLRNGLIDLSGKLLDHVD